MANQKIGEFINALAIKAGIPTDSPELKTFLSDPACMVEIDSKISDVINSGLMNEAAALNNKKIVDTLVAKGRSEAYDKTDGTLNDVLELLDPEDKEAIKALKLTNDRVSGLKGAITKLKEGQKGKNATDTAVYQKQIDDLNAALKAEKTAKTEFETKIKEQYENDSIEQNLKYSLFGRNWKLPTETETDKLFAVETASLKVKSEMAAKGYKMVRENGTLTLKTNDGLKVVDAHHNEVGLNQFIDGAISPLIAPAKQPEGKQPIMGGGGSGNTHGSNGSLESAKASLQETLAGMTM